jgi:hypothetical protein
MTSIRQLMPTDRTALSPGVRRRPRSGAARCAAGGHVSRLPGLHVRVYGRKLEEALSVCPDCSHHFPMSARRRIGLLVDPGTFDERDAMLQSQDPLAFTDSKPYRERLRALQLATGSAEAAVYGTAAIAASPPRSASSTSRLSVAAWEASSARRCWATELAIEERRPLVICASSGGARMQEGIFSLLQKAKTSAALSLLASHGIPFVSVLTDPGSVAWRHHSPALETSSSPSPRREPVSPGRGSSATRSVRICPMVFRPPSSCSSTGISTRSSRAASCARWLIQLLRCYAGRRAEKPPLHEVRLNRPCRRTPQQQRSYGQTTEFPDADRRCRLGRSCG